MFTKEDKIPIKNLFELKGYNFNVGIGLILFIFCIVFCCIMLFIATNVGGNKTTKPSQVSVINKLNSSFLFMTHAVYTKSVSHQLWATTVHYVHHAVITMVISQFSAFILYVVLFYDGNCQIYWLLD